MSISSVSYKINEKFSVPSEEKTKNKIENTICCLMYNTINEFALDVCPGFNAEISKDLSTRFSWFGQTWLSQQTINKQLEKHLPKYTGEDQEMLSQQIKVLNSVVDEMRTLQNKGGRLITTISLVSIAVTGWMTQDVLLSLAGGMTTLLLGQVVWFNKEGKCFRELQNRIYKETENLYSLVNPLPRDAYVITLEDKDK